MSTQPKEPTPCEQGERQPIKISDIQVTVSFPGAIFWTLFLLGTGFFLGYFLTNL